MLIIALVLAVIGLAALVFAVVTSNAVVAWVCIGASLLGVVLLIIDALRERQRRGVGSAEAEQPDIPDTGADSYQNVDADYPVDQLDAGVDQVSSPASESGAGHDEEPTAEPDELDSDEAVSHDHNTR